MQLSDYAVLLGMDFLKRQRKTTNPGSTAHRAVLLACCGWLILAFSASVAAQERQLLRIGTGGTAGTYLPIGSIIADSISGNTGHLSGSPHFLPNLIAIAQRSLGSASNVEDIGAGLLEAGFAQADVAHWAFTGTGPFEDRDKLDNLRGIASLYLESVHLVAREGSAISDISDLSGKRVSLDELGSGTQLEMKILLSGLNIDISDINVVYLKLPEAIDRLKQNELDAFFIVAGYPVSAVSELINEGQAKVVPINGDNIDDMLKQQLFLTRDSIPSGTYNNEQDIVTLGVPAQLIVTSRLDDDQVYSITSMLWDELTLHRLRNGHPKGNDVRLDSALAGMSIPLHPGAKRFYVEKGLQPNE